MRTTTGKLILAKVEIRGRFVEGIGLAPKSFSIAIGSIASLLCGEFEHEAGMVL